MNSIDENIESTAANLNFAENNVQTESIAEDVMAFQSQEIINSGANKNPETDTIAEFNLLLGPCSVIIENICTAITPAELLAYLNCVQPVTDFKYSVACSNRYYAVCLFDITVESLDFTTLKSVGTAKD
jgi:hypothetical protein